MDLSSSYGVVIHGARICLYFVMEFVDGIEGGFSTKRSEIRSLELSCSIVDHGGHA